MAIIYKKGKKKLEYTGIDKVTHAFGSTLEKLKSAPRKAVGAFKESNRRYEQGQARKELDDISRGFGSPENYERLYPDTKKRNDMLRKKAGY